MFDSVTFFIQFPPFNIFKNIISLSKKNISVDQDAILIRKFIDRQAEINLIYSSFIDTSNLRD